MKFDAVIPPREFKVGATAAVTLKDCGRMLLDAGEQITFATAAGAEYDIARKDWGFYATPSTNGRLKRFGWKTALVRAGDGKAYVLMVENGFEQQFRSYIAGEGHRVLCWLDDDAALDHIERANNKGEPA